MQLIECPVLLEHLGNDPRSVLCLDIETTGFFAPDDEILSLSIIDGTNAVRFHSYFCPEHNDSWPEAEAVNGISPASVRQAPLLREPLNKSPSFSAERENRRLPLGSSDSVGK